MRVERRTAKVGACPLCKGECSLRKAGHYGHINEFLVECGTCVYVSEIGLSAKEAVDKHNERAGQ